MTFCIEYRDSDYLGLRSRNRNETNGSGNAWQEIRLRTEYKAIKRIEFNVESDGIQVEVQTSRTRNQNSLALFLCHIEKQ